VDLVQILSRHPAANPILLEHRQDSTERPQPIGFTGPERIGANVEAIFASQIKVVFLATPPEVSMEMAPPLLERGIKVIDLSGAFRLRTVENYSRWYKENHTAASWLEKAVYGLPEVNRKQIPQAQLLSNPGCYPTAANLAIRPLAAAGILDRNAGIVCDAKSGVSGAGRKASLKTSFCEVSENFSAYSVLDHRHVPEVLMVSGLEESEFSFTAHLIPCDRGILETIYFRAPRVKDPAEIAAIYSAAYRNEPFVRIYAHGTLPDLKAVQRTNFCDIGFKFDPATGRGVVVSAIDNLVKGAAGQAVQNMNLMLGYDETAGLL
jgi:N-acetyl-gamma-glutamyl-phosphate reductase